MRLLIVLCILTQTALWSTEKAPCMRALIVYDTSTPEIKKASKADVKRVKASFRLLAQQAGFSFEPTTLNGSRLTEKSFQRWLKTIRSSSVDGALLYYSGSGTNGPKHQGPQIRFGAEKTLSQEKALKRISAQKPGTTMVLFDCYARAIKPQDRLNLKRATVKDISKFGGKPPYSLKKQGKRKLIKGASGTDVTKTLCSVHSKPIGGVFTTLFLSHLVIQSKAW